MTVSNLDFQPQWSQISAITKGKPTVVTFTEDHDFVKGQTVMFVVEREFKMYEINGLIGTISAITDNSITVDVDTRNFNAFSLPANPAGIPQVIPVGSENFGFTNQGTVPTGPIGPSGAFRININ